MFNGAGKYDDICTYVRKEAEAEGAIVIIFNGNEGVGFSVQAPFEVVARLPELLEIMAAQIREQQQKTVN